MINWYFLLISLSFLWAFRHPGLKPGAWKQELSRLFLEGVELYFQASLLLGVYMILSAQTQVHIESFHVLFFFCGAYLFHRIRPKDEFFFLLVFAVGIFHVSPEAAPRIADPFFSLAGMVGLMFLFNALFAGLKRRLLFSFIPTQLTGLPVALFTAALLAFGIWGFQGIIP